MTGYNVGEDLHRYAEAADGSFARRVQSVAKALGVAIVYGYPERCDDGMFNSAAFIDANGDLLANHRKSVLPDGIEGDWFDTGNAFTLFSYKGVTMAMLIC